MGCAATVVGAIALEGAEVEVEAGVEEMGISGITVFSTVEGQTVVAVEAGDIEGLEAEEAKASTQAKGMEDQKLPGTRMVYASRQQARNGTVQDNRHF